MLSSFSLLFFSFLYSTLVSRNQVPGNFFFHFFFSFVNFILLSGL